MERSAGSGLRELRTLPNLLTLSRLPMAALIWLRPRDPAWVLGWMALAGITDVLDGWLERRARERRGETAGAAGSLGTWLDPLCDKAFILSLLAAVTRAQGLPLWLIPVVAAREILQALVLLGSRAIPALKRRMRPRFRANLLGKGVTVAQFLTVGAILLNAPAQIPLAIGTGVAGVAAAAVYVVRSLSR